MPWGANNRVQATSVRQGRLAGAGAILVCVHKQYFVGWNRVRIVVFLKLVRLFLSLSHGVGSRRLASAPPHPPFSARTPPRTLACGRGAWTPEAGHFHLLPATCRPHHAREAHAPRGLRLRAVPEPGVEAALRCHARACGAEEGPRGGPGVRAQPRDLLRQARCLQPRRRGRRCGQPR